MRTPTGAPRRTATRGPTRARHPCLGALLLLLAAAPTAWADVRLQLSVQTQNAARPGSKGVKPGGTSELEVTLAKDHIAVASGQETTLYDFARRRRLELDGADRSYVDYALYDTVGLRSAEAANRKALGGAMAAADIKLPAFDPLVDAHLLSIAQPGQPQPVQAADGLAWTDAAGKPLARRDASVLPAAAADVHAYAQFLRYTLGGHPQILGALAAGRGIPRQVVFRFPQPWGDSTHTVTVKSVQPLAAAPAYSLAGWKPRQAAAGAAGLDDLLDRAAALEPAAIDAARRRIRAEADAAWRGGRVFEAYLGTVEGYLMTGVQEPAFTPAQLEQVRADPAVRRLSQILSARTKEQYAQAVGLFAALHPQAPAKAYTLKLYEANDRLQLGQTDAAMRLFAEVLRANPALAGAYKDLGDAFFMRYDMPRAWRCWDAGRRMAPAFGNFRKIDEFERRLAQDFPDYF